MKMERKTLKEWRLYLGYRQNRLAEMTGIPVQTLIAYEQMRREPPVTRAKMIARTMGLTADEVKWTKEDE